MGDMVTSILPTVLMLTSCYQAAAPRQLQGSWVAVSETWSGFELPDKLRVTEVTIKGSSITQQSNVNSETGTFRIFLQPGRPNAIDLIDGDGAGFFLGIYTIDKDVLKICYAIKRDEDRPTELTSTKGSRTVLLILKRKKTP